MLKAKRTGMAVGLVLGSWHLVWAILVSAGVAQPVLDFLFWIHFIKPVYIVEPFVPGRALVLVAATFLIGYALGTAFAVAWNRLHRDGNLD